MIGFFDQLELPFSFPILQSLLAKNRRLHRLMLFIPYQGMNFATSGEALRHIVLVLPRALPNPMSRRHTACRFSGLPICKRMVISSTPLLGEFAIPASEGLQDRHPSGKLGSRRIRSSPILRSQASANPASWIPACAGMTQSQWGCHLSGKLGPGELDLSHFASAFGEICFLGSSA